MNKKELLDIFAKQRIRGKNKVNEEIFSSIKSKECYGNCPDVNINDYIYFFVLVDVTYNKKKISKNLKEGNVANAYKMAGDTDKSNQKLYKITGKYLESDDCELLKMKFDENTKDSIVPRFMRIKPEKIGGLL